MSETVSVEKQIDSNKELEYLIEQLPLLQEGWLRLTHFTSEATARRLNAGENFDYVRQGLLGQTTDPFSNESMSELKELLKTGRAGSFTRTSFGNCVVLIDLENSENRLRNNFTVHHSAVPNENILGYVKIEESPEGRRYSYIRNPQYKPVVSKLETIKRSFGGVELSDAHIQEPAEVAQENSEKSSEDIW